MSCTIGISTRCLARVALAMLFGLIGHTAMAQSVQGTATYRERIALPPGAVFEATLEDVSRADAAASIIATTRVAKPGNPPIRFTLAYDPATIVAANRYVVRARILLNDKLVFTTDTPPPVITRGSPTDVSIMLRRVAANQTGATPSGGGGGLEGTYWRATEVAGKPTPAQDANREAHLLFETGGRFSGSDGCNRIAGSYELKGDVVRFSPGTATQKACIDIGDLDAAVRAALKGATRLTIAGDRLNLLDASGRQLAVFSARTQRSQSSTSPGLAGTSWQLVKFQGSDEKILTPDDSAKYTIEFAAAGQLTARIDCNRGRSTWKSGGPNQLQLGPLALTRAKCPAGSLHDQIVKQWANIRSYVVKDGHLFLSLMADGGIYEFEPLEKTN